MQLLDRETTTAAAEAVEGSTPEPLFIRLVEEPAAWDGDALPGDELIWSPLLP